MLNLLIAIISDTFERELEKRHIADCKERCSMILEVELIYSMFRKVPKSKNLKDKKNIEGGYISVIRYK